MRSLVLVSLLVLVGCPGPKNQPDAGDIAMFDAGRCGNDLFFTGGYEDWDSTANSFHGIAFATFQIDGDATPAHMAQTAPNGRVEMCIPKAGRTLIKVTPMAGKGYLDGHFIADAAVFAAGRVFVARGITDGRAPGFYGTFGMLFDSGLGHLLVQQQGTPVALTLTGATFEKSLASPDGVNWTADKTADKFVLFANVAAKGGATPHLAGPSIGAGDIPIVAGELTMTSVVGQ
jgi:hypothetical protein